MKYVFLLTFCLFCSASFSQNSISTEPGQYNGAIQVITSHTAASIPATGPYEVYGIKNILSFTGVPYTSGNSIYGIYSNLNGASADNIYGIFNDVSNHLNATGLYVRGSDYGVAIYGQSFGSFSHAGYFSGRVHVNGTLSKSAGSFKIDHPQDPENKYLIHSFVESPDMMNVYNGNITTDENGKAIVSLPEYFEALNIDFKYQLTTIGAFSRAMVAEEVKGNQFTIVTEDPLVKVSWQVTGVRNDPYAQKNRLVPVEDKSEKDRGSYLNPESYGLDKSRSIKVTGGKNAVNG